MMIYGLQAKNDLLNAWNQMSEAQNYLLQQQMGYGNQWENPYYDDVLLNMQNPYMSMHNNNQNIYQHSYGPSYYNNPYMSNNFVYGNHQAPHTIQKPFEAIEDWNSFARSFNPSAGTCSNQQSWNPLLKRCVNQNQAANQFSGIPAGMSPMRQPYQNNQGQLVFGNFNSNANNNFNSPPSPSNNLPKQDGRGLAGKQYGGQYAFGTQETACKTDNDDWINIMALLEANNAELAPEEFLKKQLAAFKSRPGNENLPRDLGFCDPESKSEYGNGAVCRFKCKHNHKSLGNTAGSKTVKCVCNDQGFGCMWLYSASKFLQCGSRVEHPELFAEEDARADKRLEKEARILEHVARRQKALESTLGYSRLQMREVVEPLPPLEIQYRQYSDAYVQQLYENMGEDDRSLFTTPAPDTDSTTSSNFDALENSLNTEFATNPYLTSFKEAPEQVPLRIGYWYVQMTNPGKWKYQYSQHVANVVYELEKDKQKDIFLFQGNKLTEDAAVTSLTEKSDKGSEAKFFYYFIEHLNKNTRETENLEEGVVPDLWAAASSLEMNDPEYYGNPDESQFIFYRKDKLELVETITLPMKNIPIYPTGHIYFNETVMTPEFRIPPTLWAFKRKGAGANAAISSFNIIGYRGTEIDNEKDHQQLQRNPEIEPTIKRQLSSIIRGRDFKNETTAMLSLDEKFEQEFQKLQAISGGTKKFLPVNTAILGTTFKDCSKFKGQIWNKYIEREILANQWSESNFLGLQGLTEGDVQGKFDKFLDHLGSKTSLKPCFEGEKRCNECDFSTVLVKTEHPEYRRFMCANYESVPSFVANNYGKMRYGLKNIALECDFA